ncbi:hypothetical protein [Streptomyces sp. NPDC020917]|uniref:hypothetical protein n=1 Tax=Streptomyces sp. NPDC020917 TaxID=3365102 RepID=UPI0037B20ED7
MLDLAPNILLIPGPRTRAHLDDNLMSAGVVLGDQARTELSRAFPAGGPDGIRDRIGEPGRLPPGHIARCPLCHLRWICGLVVRSARAEVQRG